MPFIHRTHASTCAVNLQIQFLPFHLSISPSYLTHFLSIFFTPQPTQNENQKIPQKEKTCSVIIPCVVTVTYIYPASVRNAAAIFNGLIRHYIITKSLLDCDLTPESQNSGRRKLPLARKWPVNMFIHGNKNTLPRQPYPRPSIGNSSLNV